ncbi:hypothetical protein FocTR4_00004108 [Fusarium oxysporum f. sp. cubense]|uniref:Uncharacterized protein n=1 Tax=Fusarium oxysporum f. sp. cubense TaxID=61366 RepID=A0A5C6T868_FUSOC|nr:hypothetical protein FocTR4_00004108 [Fusarium oxysporum f. sp. cubense]
MLKTHSEEARRFNEYIHLITNENAQAGGNTMSEDRNKKASEQPLQIPPHEQSPDVPCVLAVPPEPR